MNRPIIDHEQTFLLFEGTEVTGWSRRLVDSRNAYTSLREHFLKYIEKPDELGSALDPLDDDKSVSSFASWRGCLGILDATTWQSRGRTG